MSTSRYIIVWTSAVLLLLVGAGIFNLAVDPFDVFGVRRIDGFNATKPQASDHTFLAKSHQLARQRPATIVLGSSRPDIAIDPYSKIWPAEFMPVFNFGIPGNELFGIGRNLEQAAATGRVKFALIFLEAEAILSANPSNLPWTPPTPFENARDALKSTLTMSALGASLATVLTQRQPDNPDLNERGATSEAGFRGEVRIDGYGELFTQKNDWYLTQARQAARRWVGQEEQLFGPESPSFLRVREMLGLCRSRNIKPILILAPSHADRLETFAALGLWPAIETIKRGLASLGDEAEVWDFMGYDPQTTEAVPRRGDFAGQVQWFWEPAHFKRALGDLILRRIFGEPDDFGVQLTPVTIDARLAHVRAAQESYRTMYPTMRKRLAQE